jgi:hypothetical protein
LASGLPIVSRAWVRTILRRVIADDPRIRVYDTARYIVAEVFGQEWADENEGPARKPGGFLKNDFVDGDEAAAAAHFMRVTALAEMLLNLQHVPGYQECASQLKTDAQIESTFAELEVGKLLYLYGIRFEFNKRKLSKTNDYDLNSWYRDGRKAFADTKCKIETGTSSENTIRNSLKEARSQLPPKLPGIVFVKIPRSWIEDENYAERLGEIAISFLKTTGRVVSIKFYTMSVPVDSDSMGEVMALREITSPRQDFGTSLDWNLFPTQPVVDPSALMIAANWFQLR